MTAFEYREQAYHPSAAMHIVPSVAGSRPMSVSIYLNDLSGGGAERQSLRLAREMQLSGAVVNLVLHQLRGQLVDQVPSGVGVVNLDRRRTRHDVVPLAAHLRRHQPDILLGNVDYVNIAAVLARVLSAARTKVVITQHNPLAGELASDGRKYRIVAPAYRVLAPFVNAAVGVSDGIARQLVELGGIPASKVVRIYNAVVDGDFDERANMPVVHPWFCDGTAPIFVTAARLVPQKDHETLLRAMAIYRRGGSGRLLILGTGPLRERLENLAHELQIADAVDFVGFQSNPLPWFRRCDAFVLSSRSEGFGIALAEAMACGTPVISTDCEHGPAEILGDGRYGTLVPQHDPAAMAAALTDADKMPQRFTPELLKARAADFSNAACRDGYLSLFNRLVYRTEMGLGKQ
jgi:glycosyltransferase involved in cell wall biosynthesis